MLHGKWPGAGDPLQFASKPRDAAVDESPVRLELLLTRAPGADSTGDPREVGPHALEPRPHVLELGKLHLGLRLGSPGSQGEDVENELGTIHDPHAEALLQSRALCRRQIVVEDDERSPISTKLLPQLLGLPPPNEESGIR